MATLRSMPGDRPIDQPAQQDFADLIGRPLVIVGNGPSAPFPALEKLPANPVIFRLNWFFLESHYHFGSHVDGFFYSIPNEGLESRLAEEIVTGRYTVDRLLSPMRVQSEREGDRWSNALRGLELTELDHWATIATVPRLARHFMSRPGLPTQGMQALAFALASGFREIYLSGIDMYESSQARYGHVVTDEVAKHLQKKDLTPGYESTGAHSVDYDLAFLRSCLLEFPDARVVNLGESKNLRQYIPGGEPLEGRPTLADTPLPQQGKPKPHTTLEAADGAEIVYEPPAEAPFKEIDGRRCAFVTLVSGDYHHGARALANSLRAVTDVPLIVMCAYGANKAALQRSGLHVVDVPAIVNPALRSGGAMQSRFSETYTKLNAFRMTMLDRAVFIDSDAVVLRNLDDLFAGDDFAAVSDQGFDLDRDGFNSGVFAYSPSRALFDEMMGRIEQLPSADGGDQGFLNSFMPDWRRLPLEYNTTKRIFAKHPVLFEEEDIRVLHYVGQKPWHLPHVDDQYAELNERWLQYLTQPETAELLIEWRRLLQAHGPSGRLDSTAARAELDQAILTASARGEFNRVLELVSRAEKEGPTGLRVELARIEALFRLGQRRVAVRRFMAAQVKYGRRATRRLARRVFRKG
jgi:Glycosyl transferase family 8